LSLLVPQLLHAWLLTQVAERAPSPDFLTFMGLNWIPVGV